MTINWSLTSNTAKVAGLIAGAISFTKDLLFLTSSLDVIVDENVQPGGSLVLTPAAPAAGYGVIISIDSAEGQHSGVEITFFDGVTTETIFVELVRGLSNYIVSSTLASTSITLSNGAPLAIGVGMTGGAFGSDTLPPEEVDIANEPIDVDIVSSINQDVTITGQPVDVQIVQGGVTIGTTGTELDTTGGGGGGGIIIANWDGMIIALNASYDRQNGLTPAAEPAIGRHAGRICGLNPP